ncbi:hypothetical protein Tcan_11452 [Toxocara canis]|uniref:Uncharacterized protein n=1 Tax=Toxocara canis TaxID=6265 RepID=A0A0B2UWJ0_TOXCA|nr:hypothetical protein Tcan_11452 [Toxocara canis]
MREIFYATTIIGVLAHSMLGVPASVGERAVIEELERGGASSNETAVDVHNKTTNGVWLDIAHPIIVVEALYENSRHRIHEWMVSATVINKPPFSELFHESRLCPIQMSKRPYENFWESLPEIRPFEADCRHSSEIHFNFLFVTFGIQHKSISMQQKLSHLALLDGIFECFFE